MLVNLDKEYNYLKNIHCKVVGKDDDYFVLECISNKAFNNCGMRYKKDELKGMIYRFKRYCEVKDYDEKKSQRKLPKNLSSKRFLKSDEFISDGMIIFRLDDFEIDEKIFEVVKVENRIINNAIDGMFFNRPPEIVKKFIRTNLCIYDNQKKITLRMFTRENGCEPVFFDDKYLRAKRCNVLYGNLSHDTDVSLFVDHPDKCKFTVGFMPRFFKVNKDSDIQRCLPEFKTVIETFLKHNIIISFDHDRYEFKNRK